MTTTAPTRIAEDGLLGQPASRGQAAGAARILRHPEDGALLRPGDILVCASITPAWTPLLSSAAGIITETGGALSSAATIAREYGVPGVIAVNDATTLIHEGQIIVIDGTRGVVSLQA